MIRYIILLLVSTLIFTSCGNDTTAESSITNDQPAIEISESTDSDTETSQNQSEDVTEILEESTPESTEIEDNTTNDNLAQQNELYTLSSETVILSAINTALTLPQISGLSNSSIEASVNNLLSDGVTAITDTLDGVNPVTITYEVYRQSPQLLSVVYHAEIKIEDGSIVIWNPLNIDIPTGRLIDSSNLLSKSQLDISKFNASFSEAALAAGFDFEASEDWMGFYFTEDQIVYFLKETDLSESYERIPISLDIVKPYLNDTFQF